MKKLSLLLSILFFTLLCPACVKPKKFIVKESDYFLIIEASTSVMELKDNSTLLDYMNALKKKGEIEFTISGTLIVSINGIKNADDYSSCWMLYTSDEEFSNNAWGTAEYNEKLYGSSIFGASDLIIKEGHLYIWYYQSF